MWGNTANYDLCIDQYERCNQYPSGVRKRAGWTKDACRAACAGKWGKNTTNYGLCIDQYERCNQYPSGGGK
jgi:hypothetical protein